MANEAMIDTMHMPVSIFPTRNIIIIAGSKPSTAEVNADISIECHL